MTQQHITNTLRLLHVADAFRAKLAGEFSSVHGISVNEFFLLSHLENAPGGRLPRAELAKRMHLSASTVTRMVAPLEKIGLVGKQADDRDARLAYVVLTEVGKTRLSEATATFAKRAGYLFQDRWSDEEEARLADLLQRLVPIGGHPLA